MTRRLYAAGLLPALALLSAPAGAATSSFLVSDQGTDQILLATDLNGDGDTNDEGEVSVFFSAANASGLVSPSGNVFGLSQTKSGAVLIGDGDTDAVYRLFDLDGDGTAESAGEAAVWFSGAANAAGFKLNTPNGIAEGPDGAIYVVEADTTGSPTGDWVYRTQDLNGDGDANDEGEATRWLSLTGLKSTSSPFEIRFEGDTAYITDTAGGVADVIYQARDADGNGVIDAGEVHEFASEANSYGALFDFALDVGMGSVWTWQWLAEGGIASVFRLTDLDGSGVIDAASEVVEAWNTSLLPAGYSFLAGFGLDLNEETGEVFITSNGSTPGSDWIIRLLDENGDGTFWDDGETTVALSRLDQGTWPDRPRNVAVYSTPGDAPAPVPLPAALPLLAAGIGALGLMRRRRA